MLKNLLKGILSAIAVKLLENYRQLSLQLLKIAVAKCYLHGVQMARLSPKTGWQRKPVGQAAVESPCVHCWSERGFAHTLPLHHLPAAWQVSSAPERLERHAQAPPRHATWPGSQRFPLQVTACSRHW